MPYPVMSTDVPWSLVQNGFHKSPRFNNLRDSSATGRASGIAMMPYAAWDFKVDLSYVLGGEAIQDSVLQAFLSCYMESCGGGQFFLFTDPNDNAVTVAQGIALNVTDGAALPMGRNGDGVSTIFQLARTIKLGVDVIQNVAVAEVRLDNVPIDPFSYTVSDTGEITFTVAPPNGSPITWAGNFQYLCRFTDDTLQDLARVSKNGGGWLWSCTSVAFEGIIA